MLFLLCFIWLSLVSSLTFPTAILSIVKPSSLRAARSRLISSIRTSWPHANTKAFLDLKDSAADSVIFPKELMCSEALEALGFNETFDLSSYFSLASDGFRSPKRVRPIFVFNSSDIPDAGHEDLETIVSAIAKNPPFTFGSSLKDLFLTVPKSTLELQSMKSTTRTVLESLLIGVASSILPVWNKSTSPKEPSLVFVFESGPPHEPTAEDSASLSVKLSDCIARSWITEQGLPNFLLSYFCNFDPNKPSSAYCLDFADPVRVRFMTWSMESNEKRSLSDDEASLGRQDSSRWNNFVDHFLQNPSFFLLKFGDLLNPKLREVTTNIASAGGNVKDIPQDTRILLELEIPKIAEQESFAEQHDEQNVYFRVHNKRNDIGDKNSPLKAHWVNRTIADNSTLSKVNQMELFLPLKMLKTKIEPGPRTNAFRQVLYEKEQDQHKKLRREENCVPITWYNVFHYSIFGSSNFCV